MFRRSFFGAALLVAATTGLCAAPVGAAEPAPQADAEGQAVFETFTRIVRVVEPAIVGIRPRTGLAADLAAPFNRIGDSKGAGETAWNVLRSTVAVPIAFARSVLGATLDTFSGSARPENLGSGFVIGERGHVLTTLHTIQGVEALEAVLTNGRVAPLKVIGTDHDTDIALLGLPREVARDKQMKSVELGDSDGLTSGQWLMVVGCPVDDQRTATVGLVTGLSKDLGVGPFDEYIQTDSAIRSGSNGGPVFDERGKVVGIASTPAIEPGVKGRNAGYAIPIDAAKAVLASLEAGQTPSRGSLGVRMIRLSSERRVEYGVTAGAGALITGVDVGGPGASAGLMLGDVIIGIGGRGVFRPRDVMLALRDLRAGQPTKVAVDRKGAILLLDVVPTPDTTNASP